MKIKYKIIDKLVIVITQNNEILNKNFDDSCDMSEISKTIEKYVVGINSGLLKRKKVSKYKSELFDLMTTKKKLSKNKEDLQSSYDLAEADLNIIERKELMKRVAAIHDLFEYDNEGYVFLKGHSIPLPIDLGHALLDAHYNESSDYTVGSLVNFWQWVCLNPNEEARNDLFGWFKTGDFTITHSGLIVAYRCVAIKKQGISSALNKFIEEAWVKIKKWKKSPKNYCIIYEDFDYKLIDLKNSQNSHYVDKDSFQGFLSELYADLDTDEAGDVYTDNHTKTMTIKIGEEVSMPRKDCDEDRNASCSRGLHFMSKKYNLRLGGQKLIVLINPMNIVAFPAYDNTKGRCCAYMPIAKALEDENGDFEELGSGTIDFHYANYTNVQLEKLLEEHGLQELKDSGKIAKSITAIDFGLMKDHFDEIISKRIVNVD